MIPKTVYAYPLPGTSDPLAVFSSLYRFPYTQFLDGAPTPKYGRTSTIVFQPVEILELWGDKITVTNREQQLSLKGKLTSLLPARLQVWGQGNVMRDPTLPAFQGGAVGYFGFGADIVKQKVTDIPQAAFGIYDQCVTFDHQENQAWYVVVSDDPEQAKIRHAHFMRLISRDYLPAIEAVQPHLSWAPVTFPGALIENIRRVTDYIHAGSFDRSFLCQYFESDVPAGYDVLAHYSELRKQITSPLGGCLALGGLNVMITDIQPVFSIIDRQIEVPHISHRTPRPEGTLRDQAMSQELANDKAALSAHQKMARDEAVRLSSLCHASGILGPSNPQVDTSAGEYHISSMTRGVLADNVTFSDLVTLVAPAHAYCGEPADRAMRIIDDMESRTRGPAFGHTVTIGFNGSMTFNLNTEVVMNNGSVLRYAAGLPVSANTVPADWYDEMARKAEAALSRIGSDTESKASNTA